MVSTLDYYHSYTTVKFPLPKLRQMVPTDLVIEYSSDSEDEEADLATAGSADLDCVPDLVHEDRATLMRIIVDIVSLSLSNSAHGCSCCDQQSISTILVNMLQVTRFNLHEFERTVIMIEQYLKCNQAGQGCIKYVILGIFINQSQWQLAHWSQVLKIQVGLLSMLTEKYTTRDVGHEEIRDFNGKLAAEVKGKMQVV